MRMGQLNAAPFSAYNYLCTDPPIIGVGVTNRPGQQFVPKDTARNIRRTGEFVVNVVTEDIAEKMNICATDFPPEMSEVELAGFTTAPSQVVKPLGWPRRTPRSNAASTRRWRSAAPGSSWGESSPSMLRTGLWIPSGPYIKADELHAIGRMNGLGNYVRTRDAFMTIPRISYEEWKNGKR